MFIRVMDHLDGAYERSYNTQAFVAIDGPGFAGTTIDGIDCNGTAHQLFEFPQMINGVLSTHSSEERRVITQRVYEAIIYSKKPTLSIREIFEKALSPNTRLIKHSDFKPSSPTPYTPLSGLDSVVIGDSTGPDELLDSTTTIA